MLRSKRMKKMKVVCGNTYYDVRNKFNAKLTNFSRETQTDLNTYAKCGDIFVTKDKQLLLNCNFCNKNCRILKAFWNHLLEEHAFDTNKLEIVVKNKFNTEICNSDTFSDQHKQEEVNGSESENSCNPTNTTSNLSFELTKSKKCNTNEKCDSFNDFNINNEVNNISELTEEQVPKGYWQCDICEIILKRGQERKLHEKTHKGVKRLICETCGKGYTSRNRLLDHIRTHTGEKPFKCRFCPKSFFSHSSMKSHDKTHIGFKPFKCEHCEHYFKTKLNKQIHERKHHNNISNQNEIESNFSCKLCDKSFKCSDYLALHLKRHEEKLSKSNSKPFECNFCPSTFISNVNKNAHERLYHKGEYNYKCGFCGKGFLKLNKKRQHEEIHTRVENPYKCNLCECEYARPEGLKKHKIAKHTNDSPYKCKICKIGFESSILFQEHCKQHNIEEKLHGCIHCEARFDTKIRLNRHIIKMHQKSKCNATIQSEYIENKLNEREDIIAL